MKDNPSECEGCGAKLADGGVDFYCPNKECDHDKIVAGLMLRKIREAHERQEYQRLKAIYEKG